MSKSQRLRESDVRSMLRLMGEICEQPRDRQVRTAHLLDGLCRLTGAQAGTVTYAGHAYDAHGRRKINVIDGQALGIDQQGQRVIKEYLTTLEPADPLSEPLYSTPGVVVVRGREQLMDAAGWRRCAHFNEVRRGFGVDDCVAAKVVASSAPVRVQTVCVHRAVRERAFGQRHWRLLELFLNEVRPFINPDQPAFAQARDEVATALSPRLQQVLQRLLSGDSAKQVAAHLSLSVHTVNDHIKELHRRFNVSSRSELLALFIRR